MVEINNIHEKLLNCIQTMLIDLKVNIPFYGEYNLHVNFHERKDLPTCAVNFTSKGMNFYYNSGFLEKLSQKEVNFIVLHEDFHLLFNHPKRTITGQYDHKLSNIAQDMIINHIIWEDISHNFVEIPKDEEGRNMALFVPKDYKGKLIFEELYEWLREQQDQRKNSQCKNNCQSCGGSGKKEDKQNGQGQKGQNGKNQSQQGQGQQNQPQNGQGQGQQGQGQGQQNQPQNGQGQGQQGQGQGQGGDGQDQSDDCPDCNGSGKQDGKSSNGQKSYGPYGQNPSKEGDTIDTWSLDQILDDLENGGNGQYMDTHMGDEIPEELRESMVRDITEKLAARGLMPGNIETTLNKLRKKRKDYLREIKRSIANIILGSVKHKSIQRPNRRQIDGLKGNRKMKPTINLILDVSGSMGGMGTFEKVLSYVYKQNVAVNFMEADTQVNLVQKMKNSKKLESIPIKGLGGTAMQPAIDHVVEHFNECNTVLLTDGYTDKLDFSKVKGRVLIITVGVPCPIMKTNGKVKQICVENNDN